MRVSPQRAAGKSPSGRGPDDLAHLSAVAAASRDSEKFWWRSEPAPRLPLRFSASLLSEILKHPHIVVLEGRVEDGLVSSKGEPIRGL